MQFMKRLLKKLRQGVMRFFHGIKSFVKNHKVWTFLIVLVLVLVGFSLSRAGKHRMPTDAANSEATVERRDISEVVTGSSVVKPNAEYTIVPLVTGEILEAPFEEGDVVTKGQLMYRFDAASVETSIASADLNIQKAQRSYSDTQSDISDLTVRSTVSGTVREVFVKAGDSVNNGTKIASVYNDSKMKIRIPFNAGEADAISVGDSATLTLVGNHTTLNGTVTEVSSGTQSSAGHMLVRYVTIETSNPGALTATDSATAIIHGIACNDAATFEPVSDTAITAKTAGTVSSVRISAGDSVSSGSVAAILTSSSSDSQSYNANLSLQDALLAKQKLLEQLEDYTITAPISGTVVTKNKKAGDKYEGAMNASASASASAASGSTSSGLAVIYDMSSLYFELDVDELDVKKISVGQSAVITADASERKYSGVVENVSINGTVGTGGVTTYPVKIRINDFDDALLPGMNIEAEIAIQTAANALAVPITAVNRGDIVYVKGEKTEPNDTAPEGYYSVKVTTGISDDNYIQILSGLAEGDTIYLPAAETENEFAFPGAMGGAPGGGGMPGGGGAPGGGSGGGRPGGGGGR